MLSAIAKLLKVLNSDDNPAQVALALVFALIMGLTPLMSPHNILILLLVLVIRVNLSFFILGFALFSGLAYALDPISVRLGADILQASSLEGLWTALYQSSFWRFMAYNNTLVMGSFCHVVWQDCRRRQIHRDSLAPSGAIFACLFKAGT